MKVKKAFKNSKRPKHQAANTEGSFRIIAGEWRRRQLKFPVEPGLRPTTDRVRETLFNWLSPYIEGSRALDLFAGSGVLGLEALSRGAASCDFVDNNARAIHYLRTNLASLNCHRADIHHLNAEVWLQQQRTPSFDLVFIDPPFRQNMLQRTLGTLASNNLLAEQAWVYVETEVGLTVDLTALSGGQPQWREVKSKSMGQVAYRLLEYAGPSA